MFSCPLIVLLFFFFFNDTATTEIYTLSLHDALPILNKELSRHESNSQQAIIVELTCEESCRSAGNNQAAEQARSEEHTSELQSPKDLVCRLLLEKNKRNSCRGGM